MQNQAESAGTRENNFPPLPSFLPINPCFYQDFDVDIPAQFRKTVQIVYYIWLVYILALLWNLMAGIAFYAMCDDNSLILVVMPLVYLFLFTPCSYACWFRAAYILFRADQDRSNYFYIVFVCVFFLQICMCTLMAIGIGDHHFGMMGWLAVIAAFGDSSVAGIFVFISATNFTLLAIAMVLALRKMSSLYEKPKDASFTKA